MLLYIRNSLYWFSLDAHVVHVWCSTGAEAQCADVYAVDMKIMRLFLGGGGGVKEVR